MLPMMMIVKFAYSILIIEIKTWLCYNSKSACQYFSKGTKYKSRIFSMLEDKPFVNINDPQFSPHISMGLRDGTCQAFVRRSFVSPRL